MKIDSCAGSESSIRKKFAITHNPHKPDAELLAPERKYIASSRLAMPWNPTQFVEKWDCQGMAESIARVAGLRRLYITPDFSRPSGNQKIPPEPTEAAQRLRVSEGFESSRGCRAIE